MVRVIHIKKHKMKKIILLMPFAVLIMMVALIICMSKNAAHGGITMAQAAKMIAFAQGDFAELTGNAQEGYWYEPYVNYVKEHQLMDIRSAEEGVTYADVRYLVSQLDMKTKQDIVPEKNGYISKSDFISVYTALLPYFKYGAEIQTIEAGIAGTPANLKQAGAWETCTTQGVYHFTGLMMEDKVDKTVKMIVRRDEILAVEAVVLDGVTYRNVWVAGGENNTLQVNIYGADRTFSVKGLSQQVSGVLSDVVIEAGKVKKVNIKTDTISGKVLSVTKDYVEVDRYGRVSLDEFFMIYDVSAGFSVKSYEDIVVGYALQDFIVADGKICGAIISKGLDVDNIRVIVKTTGFNSIFHENVQLTCNEAFTIRYGELSEQHAAGEQLTIEKTDVRFEAGRITVVSENGGEIQLMNINRSQGTPSYEGSVELSLFDEGLVIVNEVDIEKYLKRVVPSEMPASFGVEALKVQAVCARSYAYKQLTNSFYSAYGAHVDDSTQFQVYNNVAEHENANAAITATRGQVLKYQGEVVQTYYYSTSCGVGTDVSLWGTDPGAYPYFASRAIGRQTRNVDLTNEQNFEQFITSKDENDYDYPCALYRWTLSVSCEQLSSSFNAKLPERYRLQPDRILTLDENGAFVSKSISTVGMITDIAVNKRVAGGAATSITVVGTQATVQIDSESCIRALLGVENVQMTTNTGTTVMASLPSTFCIFRKNDTVGAVSGFEIIGGGYGHGIGMSQNAVHAMVQDNMDYARILQFFYPETTVQQY